MTVEFETSEKTRLRRKPARGFHDEATVFRIVDAGVIAHVGYVLNGEPYVTPTAYWRDGRQLYWHGSAASRMLRAQAAGLPVCVTVSHLDGFVVARSGFATSLCYRSVMMFGRTMLIEDPDQKRRAMDVFIERLFPGRTREIRASQPQELHAMSLMTMTIDEASAKIREVSLGVVDKPGDEEQRCWAGVIPVHMSVGGVITDPRVPHGTSVSRSVAAYGEGRRLDDALAQTAQTAALAARD